MAKYVIGDVQGCFLSFQKLLQAINFDETKDRLILLGDIVNRGPLSLDMLRFVMNHNESIDMVLGNHEIFLIGLFLGATKATKPHTLQAILDANDRALLIDFLRSRPLLKQEDDNIFVHAGILPIMPIETALEHALKLRHILMGPQAKPFLTRYFEKIPHRHKENSSQKRTLRLALASFTLLRMCETPGDMDLSYSGEIAKAPRRLSPWFTFRDHDHFNIYFGHWAALGFFHYKNYTCLDSGCVWGKYLTAKRLDDGQIFHVDTIDTI